MNMKKILQISIIALPIVMVASCGKPKPKPKRYVQEQQSTVVQQKEQKQPQIMEEEHEHSQSIDQSNEIEDIKEEVPKIFFDFDKSEVKPEYLGDLYKYMDNVLAKYPNATFVLKGHTDERGGREYNLALSTRRAAAVEKVLLDRYPQLIGRTQQVGYGIEQLACPIQESKPDCPLSEQGKHAKNRRVELEVRK